jgi:hypothetical protein
MQEQRSVLVLSIASVVIMAVFLNQSLVNHREQEFASQGTRGVASFNPTDRDFQWEHELAQKLSTDTSARALALAEKPSLRDELVFAFLEGKYGMKLNKGRIESLEFIDAQAGEKPLAIDNKKSFLSKFSEAFGLQFSEVNLKEDKASEQVYSLIDSKRTIVGEAHFQLDDAGRVLALKISQ